MQTCIALLRGINVGGNTRLAMKDLTATLSALGHTYVRTYIQSGNVVFKADDGPLEALAARMAGAIEAAHGISPSVMVLGAADLAEAVRQNPYPEAVDDPKSLHLFILEMAPTSPDIAHMDSLAANGERFHLDGRYFYLHAPNGIGRSKLAAKAEACLGVAATARNWRTVTTLMEMADEA